MRRRAEPGGAGAPRIVFLSPAGTMGGGERSLLDLIVSLRACEPALGMHLIACEDGPLLEAARAAGASAQVLAMPARLARVGDAALRDGDWLAGSASLLGAALAARPFARRLTSAIAAAGADLVHSNGIKTHLLAALGDRDRPIVWHVRDLIGRRPLSARMLAHVLARVPARRRQIIAVSRAVADDARTWLGRSAPAVPIDVVHNAIDTAHFAPGAGDGATLDRLARLPVAPPGTIRIGMLATNARWKGQEIVLEAAAMLRRRGVDRSFRHYIVGGPVYRTAGSQFTEAELRRLAASRGIGEIVGFIPFQSDPAPLYRALDIVLHASTQPEPFGRTIVEAMACGRALIVTSEGGAAELIRDGHDARAIPPRNPGALADAVAELARDAKLRARLGASARATAVQRFSRQRLGPQVLEIYRRLLND